MKIIMLIIMQLILSSLVFASTEEEYLQKGNAYLASGNNDRAAKTFESAIKENPKSAAAYKGLGLAYFQSGNNSASSNIEIVDKAIRAFNQSASIKPDAEIYYYLGLAYLVEDNKKDAVEIYRLLEPLNPSLAQNLSNKINNYQKPGSYVAIPNPEADMRELQATQIREARERFEQQKEKQKEEKQKEARSNKQTIIVIGGQMSPLEKFYKSIEPLERQWANRDLDNRLSNMQSEMRRNEMEMDWKIRDLKNRTIH